jgi:L-rhamnose-H+ transport protein
MAEHFSLGMLIVFVAGLLNGSFTLPMKYSRTWAWENIWSVYSTLALLALPWIFAIRFVPNLAQVYHGLPWGALLYPALFGLLWGIAQTTFGLAVNIVGMAVAYAIVCGLVCVVGAIVPILVFSPADLFRPTGLMMLASMPVFLSGLFLYGKAGTRRDRELSGRETGSANFKAGFALCIFTGIVGGAWNVGFAFSRDILHRSVGFGASAVTSTYAAWAVVLSGAFLPNLLYPVYLLSRRRTWAAFAQGNWVRELGLGAAMAVVWFSAIVAYGMGATMVGRYGTSLGFILYIASTIVASNGFGIITGEWKGTSSSSRKLLAAGVAAILASIVILNLGGLLPSTK